MNLTYKMKHSMDLTRELLLARKVAQFAIENRDKLSTKYVKHIGLNAEIANQILWKYGRNKKCKSIRSVNLSISGHHLRRKEGGIYSRQLKTLIPFNKPEMVKQIEINKDYLFITVEVPVVELIITEKHVGVDFNTTGHSAVVAVKETGKVYKLGKRSLHTHNKYSNIRRKLQKLGKYSMVKKIKNRESRIIRDTNHKVSRFIVNLAVKEKGGINLEKLTGIRQGRRGVRKFKYALNSWGFHQLGKFIEYKAALAGITVTYLNPAFTSVACSRCGMMGTRIGKSFKCLKGHVEHADVNAAFNLAFMSDSIARLQAVREARKGGIGTPQ